jgi:hypothetical protein
MVPEGRFMTEKDKSCEAVGWQAGFLLSPQSSGLRPQATDQFNSDEENCSHIINQNQWSIGAVYILDFRFRILDLMSDPLAGHQLFAVLIRNPNSKIQNRGDSITPAF